MKSWMWKALLLVAVAGGLLAVLSTGPVYAQGDHPDPTACAKACEHRAERVMKACLEKGGAPERCRNQARQEREKCVAACRTSVKPAPVPGDPAPRACKQRCEVVGRKVLEACMALPIGPLREQCERRSAQAVRMCLEKTCPPKLQPAPSCKESCEQRAHKVYEQCVAGSTGTTPPTECGPKARAFLKECLAKHCNPSSVAPSPRPAPGGEACRQACHERVSKMLESCRAAPGASPERCRAQAAEKLEACLKTCGP